MGFVWTESADATMVIMEPTAVSSLVLLIPLRIHPLLYNSMESRYCKQHLRKTQVFH